MSARSCPAILIAAPASGQGKTTVVSALARLHARQGRTVSLGMSIMYPSIIVLPPLFGWFVDHTHSWTGAWSLLSAVMLVGSALLARVPERARVA
jgi:drug/metabolite transporter (DMT)-like permease